MSLSLGRSKVLQNWEEHSHGNITYHQFVYIWETKCSDALCSSSPKMKLKLLIERLLDFYHSRTKTTVRMKNLFSKTSEKLLLENKRRGLILIALHILLKKWPSVENLMGNTPQWWYSVNTFRIMLLFLERFHKVKTFTRCSQGSEFKGKIGIWLMYSTNSMSVRDILWHAPWKKLISTNF